MSANKSSVKRLLNNKVPESVPEPALYPIACSEMNKLVWLTITEEMSADKMAFATKTEGGVYKVFVNDKIPEVFHDYFQLHEFGHILFGHLKDLTIQQKQFNRKVLACWDQIKPHLELTEEEEKLSKLELAEKFVIPLSGLITNYATDMEVNSKLFSSEEWQRMLNITDLAYIASTLKDGEVTQELLDEFSNFLKGKAEEEHLCKPVWPEDYGFPIQLSFQEYLDLILHNIDQFMNFLRQNAQGQGGQGKGQGQSQEGEGEGQGELSDEQKKEVMSKLKKLSLDDIEKLRKEANTSDMDEAGNGEAAKEAEAAAGGSKDGDSNDGSASNRGGDGMGFGHGSGKDDILPLKDSKGLARFLEKEAFSKKIENVRNNEMYYYNRRKYGDKYIIAKQTKEDVYRPGNMYILVDCSGSIDRQAIATLLTCTRSLSKKCGPKSRVIWWDTNLCADKPLREKQDPMCGGGTDIGSGIAYVRDKYLKSSNDKLIIISDYEDTLAKWSQELDRVKNDVTGICWTSRKPNTSLEKFINDCNYGRDFDTKKFLKKVHTKIVVI